MAVDISSSPSSEPISVCQRNEPTAPGERVPVGAAASHEPAVDIIGRPPPTADSAAIIWPRVFPGL